MKDPMLDREGWRHAFVLLVPLFVLGFAVLYAAGLIASVLS